MLVSKIKSFEFVVEQLLKWFEEKNGGSLANNDFSKLKLIKLLFFVSAVKADEKSEGLLNTFDCFYAMPYGHVESDVYSSLHISELYKIDKKGLTKKIPLPPNYFDTISLEAKTLIEESVAKLRVKNDELINYSPFKLVDLSHEWQSWKTIFNLAKSQGKLSLQIPSPLIQLERKIFTLDA